MGVQGLWKLVEPIGRPVVLETLDGKVLAVDVSLWLHQAVKGMRDRQGNPVPHAHLLVLFNRLCKLLFYGVKPVLVFDGGVPHLKQRTLAARRQRQAKAEDEVESAQDKLLVNFLQSKALEAVTGIPATLPSTSRCQQPDLFSLPPMPKQVLDSDDDNEAEKASVLPLLSQQGKSDFLLDGRLVDVQSDDFKALPSETQHEVLVEMKRSFKDNSWSHLDSMPQKADNFSQFQLQNILQRSQLSGRLKSVRNDLARQSAGVATVDLAGQPGLGSSLGLQGATVQASQLASDSSTHFVFIKHKLGLDKNKSLFDEDCEQQETTERKAPENTSLDASGSESEPASPLAQRPSRTLGESTPMVLSDSEDEVRGHEVATAVPLAGSHTPKLGGGGFLVDSDSDDDKGIPSEASGGYAVPEPDCRSESGSLTDLPVPKDPGMASSPCTEAAPSTAVAGSSDSDEQRRLAAYQQAEAESLALPASQGSLEIVVPLPDHSAPGVGAAAADGFSLFDASDFIPAADSDAPVLPPLVQSSEQPVHALASREERMVPITAAGNEGGVESQSQRAASSDVDSIDLTAASQNSSENAATTDDGVHSLHAKSVAWDPSDLQMSSEDLRDHLSEQQRALRNRQQSQQRQIPGLSNQMVAETQNLLNLFGVPYVIAPMEAEAQCAWLEENGLAEGIITDDSDVWLFGAKTVYKNFFNQNHDAEVYTSSTLKGRMGLSREELIGVAFLCGSDYTAGVKGIGCVLAMEVMNDFRGGALSGLGKFSAWWKEAIKKGPLVKEPTLHTRLRKLVVPASFPDSRVYNAYTDPLVDPSREPFEWASPDLVTLRQFAADVFGWTTQRTDEVLLPVIQRMNKKQAGQQALVTEFFASQPGANQVRGIKSKRVKRVVLRMLDREKEGAESAEPGPAAKRNLSGPCLSSSGSDSEDENQDEEEKVEPGKKTPPAQQPSTGKQHPKVAVKARPPARRKPATSSTTQTRRPKRRS